MNKLYTSIDNWNDLRGKQSEDDPICSVALATKKCYTRPITVELTFKDYKQCSMFALKYSEYL